MTFGSTGVDSPIAGINVSNRADVTKALTGQSSAIVGSPLSAEEFIRAVKVINDAASYDKKISYEDAFYKIIELVPLIKEGERISPQRITDDLFYIIHNGKPRPTFDKSWLELTIGKRKYTRDSFLNMVVQQLQKSKSDQEKRIKDDIISAISGLAVMLGKGLSKYEKDMEDIRNGKDYSEDLKKLNKIGSDVLNTIENPLGRKEFDASLVSAGERLSIIIKYNSFLSATDKAMEIIAAGSPLTIEERVELLLQRLPSFMQKKLSEDKVLSLLKKVTEAKYYFAGIRRGTFSSNLAEATLLEAKLREAKEQGRMAASPLGKINKKDKRIRT